MAERIVWTSPQGVSIDLTDEAAGYGVLANGTRGLRSVTYEITSGRYAGLDGETVHAIRAEANRPSLGLMVSANSEAEFRTRARGLVRAMRPTAGAGTLAVSNETGETRTLRCYCADGMAGDEAVDVTLPGSWWKLILHLYAPDPWWRGPEQVVDVGLGAPTSFFPITPVNLSSSSVEGTFSVDLSDSDAPSFPVWTVTGPGNSLILTNLTTGRAITVNVPLSAGQTMVINTQPGEQSVRRGDGVNLMGYLDSDPSLWPLIEGPNVISAVLAGATAASRIRGVYSPRFAGI